MSPAVAIAMDIGGTWVRAAIIGEIGEIIWRDRAPTNVTNGKDAILATSEGLLRQALSHTNGMKLSGIGIGVAGPVDKTTGVLYDPPNLAPLAGLSLKTIWESNLGHEIYIGNDANLAALGEYKYGSGRGADTLIYVTISTGIGGGIIIDGHPFTGAHGMAGELGHMFIKAETLRCACGKTGCLEAIASGTSIAGLARKLVGKDEISLLNKTVSGDVKQITAANVFDAAREGDHIANQVIQETIDALAIGLVNILHILDPDVIVIGGAVSRNWNYIKTGIQTRVEAQAMGHILKHGFKIVQSSLGDDSGLYGAAATVFQRHQT